MSHSALEFRWRLRPLQGRDSWHAADIVSVVPALGWWLLLANLFWVLAYDTEYAMVDRDDDLKIGIQTSAITLGRFDVPAVMAFYAIYLAAWAWLGVGAGLGRIFLAGMVGAALLSIWHYTLIRDAHARWVFSRFPAQPLAGLHGVRRGGS